MKEQLRHTVDFMFLSIFVLRQSFERRYHENSNTKKSFKYAVNELLYDNEPSNDEIHHFWSEWAQTYNNGKKEIQFTSDSKQYDQLFDIFTKTEKFKKIEHEAYLKGIDFKSCVIDKKAEMVIPCKTGFHYETILDQIKTQHANIWNIYTLDQKDQFILSNFKLKGETDSIEKNIQALKENSLYEKKLEEGM